MINREYGSDFHYVDSKIYRQNKNAFFFEEEVQFYFSGRVALKAVLLDSIIHRKLNKLYVPSYYCHEVYEYIKDLNIVIEFYECNPLKNELPIDIDDRCD